MTNYDKLGRKKPEFDRSAAAKKGAATKLRKDPNYFSKMGTMGGRASSRGYFGKLKDENPEKFAEVTRKGGQTSKERRAEVRGTDG